MGFNHGPITPLAGCAVVFIAKYSIRYCDILSSNACEMMVEAVFIQFSILHQMHLI